MKSVIACVAMVLLVSLPAGWAKEEEKPKHFYYNTVTGKVSWSDPKPTKHIDDEGRIFYTDPLDTTAEPWWENDLEHMPKDHAWAMATVPKGEEQAGKPYFFNKITKETAWETPAGMAWKKMLSEHVFYYNTVTGESSQDRPEQMGFHDKESGRSYWIDKKTGEPTWESEHWWTEVTIGDEDPEYAGHKYWVQELTQEVSVTKPEALSWVEWHYEADADAKPEL